MVRVTSTCYGDRVKWLSMPPTRRDFLGAAIAATAAAAAPAPFSPDFATALDAAAAIKAKRISSVELTELAFRRMDRYNPKINAVILEFRAASLARAREADQALAKKQWWGPFHGVPVTVKESYGMEGVPTTAGLPQYKDFRPKQNAIAVDRILRAGAIVIGKTNVPVMLADLQSYNPIYGTSNNPWDLARTPGGSTGGGAAALAAGLGHLTLGSDIGGSIRIPSHFCGIYGHKPTLELVSTLGHVPPFVDPAPAKLVDLSVCGPMARSAEDLRVALEAIGGPAGPAAKAYRWSLPAPRRTRLADFRVGCILDDPLCRVGSDVRGVLESAVEKIEKAGVRVDRGWPAGVNFGEQLNTYLFLLYAVMAPRFAPEVQEALRAAYRANPKNVAGAALVEPHSRWLDETAKRLAARAVWEQYFRDHDIFLMPVAFVPAFPHDHSEPFDQRKLDTPEGKRPYPDITPWIMPPTLSGCPATVAPAGRTAAGLPVGIQIMGPYLEDATTIEFARLIADVVGGFVPPNGFTA
jgi:amidase